MYSSIDLNSYYLVLIKSKTRLEQQVQKIVVYVGRTTVHQCEWAQSW